MGRKFVSILATIGGVFVYIILGWTIVVPTLVSMFVLDYFFRKRVTPTLICDENKYYPGLLETQRYFMSKENKLYGAFFSHEGHKPYKGLMIVSHGIGCSHRNYLQVIDYFTRKDYLVFSFDMTGCCLSEGNKGMDGLQRAIIDLKSAILFASAQEEAKGLDVFVFGHSWSGYASAAVLNDEEVRAKVKAVASLCGFHNSWDVMKDQGIKKVGKIVKLSRPFVHILGRIRYGKIVKYKGLKGINKYDGPVYVAHSRDDKTVAFSYSIARLQDKCTNKKAEFHIYDNLGHTLYRPLEAEASITKKREGKAPLKLKDENIFQYFMDDRYRFSTREEVFGMNEEFMDTIEDFFVRAKGDIC